MEGVKSPWRRDIAVVVDVDDDLNVSQRTTLKLISRGNYFPSAVTVTTYHR